MLLLQYFSSCLFFRLFFSLLISLPIESVNSLSPSPPIKVWLYHLAEFECANALLCSIDWKELRPLSDPNTSWVIFKETFLCIMTATVPSKRVFPYQHFSSLGQLLHLVVIKIPSSLLLKELVLLLFGPSTIPIVIRLTYLRDLKSKFFHNLFTSLSLWSFWSAVKRIHSKPGSIPSLIYNGSPVTSPSSQADVLNQYFSSCFNKSTAPISPLPILHYKTSLQIFSTT